MNDKTVRDAFMEVVVNQLETGDPPETKATLDRLMADGNSRGEAMQLIAAVARKEMQEMMSEGRAFDNVRYAKLLAKLPKLDRGAARPGLARRRARLLMASPAACAGSRFAPSPRRCSRPGRGP